MDPNVQLGDRLSRQRAHNPKKTIKMFGFERRHLNRLTNYVEVERVFVLSPDSQDISEEDVLNGLNFDFVPFETLANRNSSLSDCHARLLRMNFETALANLRRHVDEEKLRPKHPPGTTTASGINLNNSVVHMFVPTDLRRPEMMWQDVIEPVGRVPHTRPFELSHGQITTSLPRVIESKFQDSVSRIASGAVMPNSQVDPCVQRENASNLVDHLAARRRNYLRGGQMAVRGVFHVPIPMSLPVVGCPPSRDGSASYDSHGDIEC